MQGLRDARVACNGPAAALCQGPVLRHARGLQCLPALPASLCLVLLPCGCLRALPAIEHTCARCTLQPDRRQPGQVRTPTAHTGPLLCRCPCCAAYLQGQPQRPVHLHLPLAPDCVLPHGSHGVAPHGTHQGLWRPRLCWWVVTNTEPLKAQASWSLSTLEKAMAAWLMGTCRRPRCCQSLSTRQLPPAADSFLLPECWAKHPSCCATHPSPCRCFCAVQVARWCT